MWAEFFLPNYGWIQLDSTSYGFFGKSQSDRLILSKGSNIYLGHGYPNDPIPWFHMPHVNDLQEETEEVGLSVVILP